MNNNTFGPYNVPRKILFVIASLILSVLVTWLLLAMILSSAGDLLTVLILAGCVSVFWFFTLSISLDSFKTYSLEEDGISVSNLVTRTQRKISYREIASAEVKVAGTSRIGNSRDFEISIRCGNRKFAIYFPTRKQKDQAEFIKLLAEKIGKDKIKQSSG